MDPTSAAICLAAKQTSFSKYDHVGLIVESMSDDNDFEAPRGTLYLIEANIGGVTMRKLDERLRRTKSTTVAARKLIGPKPDVLKELLWDEAVKLANKGYNSSFLSMAGALLSSYAAHGHSHSSVVTDLTRLDRTMSEIEREIEVRITQCNLTRIDTAKCGCVHHN
jgi:hypothetical protein